VWTSRGSPPDRVHLLLRIYGIKVLKDGFYPSFEKAGELDFHLGLGTLVGVCSLSPKAMIGWLGQEPLSR